MSMKHEREPLFVIGLGNAEDPTALPPEVAAYERRHKRKPGYDRGPDVELNRPAAALVRPANPGGDIGCGPVVGLVMVACLLITGIVIAVATVL